MRVSNVYRPQIDFLDVDTRVQNFSNPHTAFQDVK